MSNHQEIILEYGVSVQTALVNFCVYRTTSWQCLRTVLRRRIDIQSTLTWFDSVVKESMAMVKSLAGDGLLR